MWRLSWEQYLGFIPEKGEHYDVVYREIIEAGHVGFELKVNDDQGETVSMIFGPRAWGTCSW